MSEELNTIRQQFEEAFSPPVGSCYSEKCNGYYNTSCGPNLPALLQNARWEAWQKALNTRAEGWVSVETHGNPKKRINEYLVYANDIITSWYEVLYFNANGEWQKDGKEAPYLITHYQDFTPPQPE